MFKALSKPLRLFKKWLAGIVLSAFLINSTGFPSQALGQQFYLPTAGQMLFLSQPSNPPILKGIKVHVNDPFSFNFILDHGDSTSVIAKSKATQQSQQEQLKQDATKLIKYFLAGLTIPENDLWVNLSPYEKDRIIPHAFGLTEMGRDLLAQDYILKQVTAFLMYPEGKVGQNFWKKVYAQAYQKYGTTNIPVNTFNKVWIIPQKAVVYEHFSKVQPGDSNGTGAAFIVKSQLKVMLEEDYLSLEKHEGIKSYRRDAIKGVSTNQLGSQIVRQILIPELTREVNEGQNFMRLRQVYNSLILATWYKKKIKDSLLLQVYAQKNKVAGIKYDRSVNPLLNTKSPHQESDIGYIYQQYLKAFKKGVYNYIKEDIDPATQQMIPRKYFSGGTSFSAAAMSAAFGVTSFPPTNAMPTATEVDAAMSPVTPKPVSQRTETLPKNFVTFSTLKDKLDSARAQGKKRIVMSYADDKQKESMLEELKSLGVRVGGVLSMEDDRGYVHGDSFPALLASPSPQVELQRTIQEWGKKEKSTEEVVVYLGPSGMEILKDTAVAFDKFFGIESFYPHNLLTFGEVSQAQYDSLQEMDTLMHGFKTRMALPGVKKELVRSMLREANAGIMRDASGNIIEIAPSKVKGKFGVLELDADFFKAINDIFGHQVGDKVLKGIAALLISKLRANDVKIRFGGEEIIIVMHFTENERDLDTAKIQAAIQEKLETIKKELHTSISELNGNSLISSLLDKTGLFRDVKLLSALQHQVKLKRKREGSGEAYVSDDVTELINELKAGLDGKDTSWRMSMSGGVVVYDPKELLSDLDRLAVFQAELSQNPADRPAINKLWQELYKQADQALYRVKNEGGRDGVSAVDYQKGQEPVVSKEEKEKETRTKKEQSRDFDPVLSMADDVEHRIRTMVNRLEMYNQKRGLLCVGSDERAKITRYLQQCHTEERPVTVHYVSSLDDMRRQIDSESQESQAGIHVYITDSRETFNEKRGDAEMVGNFFGMKFTSHVHNFFEMMELKTRSLVGLDQLTGLPTRARADELMEQMIQYILRQLKDGLLVSVLYDADFFGAINSIFGHDAGDAVIKLIGEVLAAETRPSDINIRLGGEEFTSLMYFPNATDKSTVQEKLDRIAKRLREALQDPKRTEFAVFQMKGHGTTRDYIKGPITAEGQIDEGQGLMKMVEGVDSANKAKVFEAILHQLKVQNEIFKGFDNFGKYQRGMERRYRKDPVRLLNVILSGDPFLLPTYKPNQDDSKRTRLELTHWDLTISGGVHVSKVNVKKFRDFFKKGPKGQKKIVLDHQWIKAFSAKSYTVNDKALYEAKHAGRNQFRIGIGGATRIASIQKFMPKKPQGDSAMGGIDLSEVNKSLSTQNRGIRFNFHMTPAMLARLRNSSGFAPVDVTFRPVKSISKFLEISS
ncbi:MAG: GGDEF domain-containing protein [Candidatus Omnitrophica bacterium]|nr:GGDEF domain-containing protein [Candidatus Omnitrophota bacterium]